MGMSLLHKCLVLLSAALWLLPLQAALSEDDDPVYHKTKSVQVYFGKTPMTIINNVRTQIIRQAKEAGMQVENYELAGSLEKQLKIIKENARPNVPIIIHVSDREHDDLFASELISLNLPLIFVMRKPTSDKINLYSDCWFVRSNSIEGGLMLGESVYQYVRRSYPDWDQNRNGVLDLLLITGVEGHRDTRNRTTGLFNMLKNRNINYKVIREVKGNFNYEYTMDQLAAIFDTGILSDIEAIVAENDDMALAAISVLVDYGDLNPRQKGWPVIFGVDGLSDAKIQIAEGYMENTVVQDAETIARVCVSLAQGQRDLNRFIDENRAVVRDNDIQLPYYIYKTPQKNTPNQ